MSFFWFQKAGSDRTWHRASADTRAKIISEIKPTFVTVLDASDVPEEGWTKEQFLAMKYSGPLYFDWDAEDCSDTIADFVGTLTKFRDAGLNLACISIYATGGRGFHVEIPMGCLMAKPPPGGITQLPYIYREIARTYVTDTLDMRVYSGRMGRMWRTCGVQRENGNYKVQISVDEALAITSESYAELVKSPRPALVVAAPEFCAVLNGDFAQAKKKVEGLLRSQKKAKSENAILKTFNGEYPPAVRCVLQGEHYNPDKGFNQIAMQLAITANALGKTEAEFLADSEGFAKAHVGDSSRYNSPNRRKAGLREMYWYTNGNDLYSFSVGAVKNICAPDVPSMAITGQAESQDSPYEEDIDSPVAAEGEKAAPDYSIYQGLKLTKHGVMRRSQDGDMLLSHLVWTKGKLLKDPHHGTVLGLTADIRVRGDHHGVKVVPMDIFKSRASLSTFCMSHSSTFTGTDTQAGIIGMILCEQAEKGDSVEYVMRREGLDLLQNPRISEAKVKDPVWVSPYEILQNEPAEGTPPEEIAKYAYAPIMSDGPIFNSDLMSAKDLEDSEQARRWLSAVLDMNSPSNISQVLGWFVSAFHRQFYQETHGQFPLLHLYGTAGSGKTMTAKAFQVLHFNKNKPMEMNCGNSTTSFSLRTALCSSASIPALLDEYKPSELTVKRQEELLMAFRLAYNQGEGASGGMSDGSATSSFRHITRYSYSTPIVFLGESQEMQSAIMQRTVAVGFSAHTKNKDAFDLSQETPELMSQLGKLLAVNSMSETVASRRKAIAGADQRVRAGLQGDMHDRQVFNLSVLICGLEFLRDTLHPVFGNAFDDRLNALVDKIIDTRSEMAVQVVAESIKVLSDLAMMSRMEDVESPEAIREGYEYIVVNGHLDLLMKESFIKYHSWCKKKGFNPLYRSPEIFVSALAKVPACEDFLVLSSPLRKSASQRVFRFSLEKLRQDGCDDFRTKLLGN